MFNFNAPNLIVKGIVEQRVTNPDTGDILAYERLLTDAASDVADSYEDIVGFGGKLEGMIPSNRRVTGTYTAQSFSLDAKQLELGGQLAYNAVSFVCEQVTANAEGALYVTRQPALYYGQNASDTSARAYVRANGVTADGVVNTGTNVGVALTETAGSGYLVGYAGVANQVYYVTYPTAIATARSLSIPDAPIPRILTVEQTFGVYATQNGSAGDSTLVAKLHIVYPYAMFTAGGSVSGSQTSITTTNGTWAALSAQDIANGCENCSFVGNVGYYILVPCDNNADAIEGLAVVGGGISVVAGSTKQIPVKFVMDDGSVVQPTYTDMTYASGTASVATVSVSGVVSGLTAGTSVVTITLKADNTKTTTCTVTVTSA